MTAAPSNFWSRRRAAVQAEETARATAEAQAEAEALARVQEAKPDEQILAELGLPDPDQLGLGDDFKVFLQDAVPERLRRRALRRLWRSNPVLANLDGLVDHGEDYTDAATVMPDLKTSYQVGKGLLRHVTALAEAEATGAKAAEPGIAATDPIPVEEKPADPPPAPSTIATTDADAVAEPRPRRHMRFSFET